MRSPISSPRRVATAALLALSLVAAGCGDDAETPAPDDAADDVADDAASEPDDAADEEEPEEGADEAAGSAEDAAVQALDIAFDPADIEVAAGSAVVWTNGDAVNHTVTSGEVGAADGTFDEQLPADGEVSVTFDEAGTFPYYCEIHPSMVGTVTVTG